MRFLSPDAKRLHKLEENVIDNERKKKAKEKERGKYERII
jgi:hypothetical protein